MHNTFKIINKWFKVNPLSLKYEKTQCVQFRTKRAMQTDSKIAYGSNIISNGSHTKFLDLVNYNYNYITIIIILDYSCRRNSE
jgi:hypothetical protein